MRVVAAAMALVLAGGATAVEAQDVAAAAAPAPVDATPATPPTAAPPLAPEPATAAAVDAAAPLPADTASPPADASDAAAPYDPLEKFNRVVWKVNRGLDNAVIKPGSSVYRKVAPRPVRRGLSHALSNLSEPWSFVNGILQGKPKRAFNSLGRFVINSTIGVAGLADQASKMGLKPTPEDFGLTLARWGVKAGPYLVLPLLGPSTFRDGVGTGVAFYADPYRLLLRQELNGRERLGENAVELLSIRSDVTDAGGDTFLKTSLDPYAAARSAYLQTRAAAIRDENGGSDSGATAGGSAADDAAMNAAVAELKAEPGSDAAAPGAPGTPGATTATQPHPEAPPSPPKSSPK